METITAELVEDKSRRDTRGRRILELSQREELIEQYKRSGLTQKEFARRENVNVHTFVSWLGQRRRTRDEGGETLKEARTPKGESPEEARFVELGLSGNCRPGLPMVLEIELPDGRLLRGAQAAPLATLAKLLGR